MKHAMVAVACLGNLVLMIGSHNWFYGLRLSKRVGDIVHLVHALLILALPILVYALFGRNLENLLYWALATPLQNIFQLYLLFCLLVALLWFPGITLYRLFRKEPVKTLTTTTMDISQQLGHRPIGNGHHAFLAHLPGNEIFQVQFVEKVFVQPNLPPEWDGLTILHLSDLHFHGTPDREWFRVIFDRCADLQPDIVAVTGDIADSATHHRWIIPLLGRLRWKEFGVAILGNHDHRQDVSLIRKRLRKLRFHVPANDWMQIELRGIPLVLIGHEGPWLDHEPNLTTCPEGVFRLCLSHTPDNIAWARKNKIPLMLSGHVHGGQIRMWPFGPILLPSRYGRRHDRGLYDEAPTMLHVTQGLSGEHPIRYGCMPEVVLLRLEREK